MRTRTKHGQKADVATDIRLFWSINLLKYQRVKKVPPGRLELPAQGLGILGAAGSCFSFIATVTIIPFMPNGWAASAGGFPAMAGNIPFLMKDVVLLAVSVYLLRQDVVRVSLSAGDMTNLSTIRPSEMAGPPPKLRRTV
jgi:Protein of unknown function, DUF417